MWYVRGPMASHPFKPDGSKLPLILTVGGMIIMGIITMVLGLLFWTEPVHEADESTEGMFLTAPPPAAPAPGTAAERTPEAVPGANADQDAGDSID